MLSLTHEFNVAWFIDILLILVGTWSMGRTKKRHYKIAAMIPVVIGILGIIGLMIHNP